jgi:CS domain
MHIAAAGTRYHDLCTHRMSLCLRTNVHDVLLLLLTAEGNGGKTDRYEWAQTLGELSVTVPLPPGTKSRDIVCTISRKRLKAGIKGQPLIIDVSMLSI